MKTEINQPFYFIIYNHLSVEVTAMSEFLFVPRAFDGNSLYFHGTDFFPPFLIISAHFSRYIQFHLPVSSFVTDQSDSLGSGQPLVNAVRTDSALIGGTECHLSKLRDLIHLVFSFDFSCVELVSLSAGSHFIVFDKSPESFDETMSRLQWFKLNSQHQRDK